MTHRALKRRPRWLPLPERSALSRPLPWLILLALMLVLGGVSLIARVALHLASPDVVRYGGDLGARGGADYSFWPGGPLIPPLNPQAVAAAAADEAPPPASGPPAPQDNVPIAVVGAPTSSPAAPSVAPASPSPEPTQMASATATASPPAPTATATRTAAPRQAPTSAPTRQPSTAVPVSAPSAPPSATPVSAPGAPGIPSAPATPRPTNTPPPATATRTPQPSPTNSPLPTSTTRPTSAPTAPPGTPTTAPSPTSTPEPPQPILSFASASYTLSEAKGEVTVELRLNDTYFRPVTVSYASGGGSATTNSDYKPVSGSLTFSPGEVIKSFKLTALADELNEPSESFSISIREVTNASVGEPSLARITITDSDTPPTVRFAGATRTVDESVGSVGVTIELSEPSAINVSVPFTVVGMAGLGDHDLRAGAAIIPAGASSVRIRFAIVDDRIDEDAETLSIYLGTPANAELDTPSVYMVTIADDDTAGVVVSATSLELSEALTATNHLRTYTIRLDSEPTAPVTITLAPDAQAMAQPAALVFTAANWNTPQTVTVTAVDDDVDEAAQHKGVVRYAVASDDPKYYDFAVAELALSIADDDTAGVVVSATSLALSEVPTATNHLQRYTIRLDSQPTAPVTITLAPDEQATVEPASLVFTEVDWRIPQTVTVTAVDDDIDEAAAHPSLVGHTVASADGNYDGFEVDDLTLEIADDDTAGVWLSATSLALSEVPTATNHIQTYVVKLTSEPTAPVMITLSEILPDDPLLDGRLQLDILTPTLTFTAANWNVEQSVAVRAVDDAVDEDLDKDITPHSAVIRYAVSSNDENYDLFDLDDLGIEILDNDEAGVIIAPSSVTVIEGMTTVYSVTLTSEPLEPVTIELSATTGISLAPISLTFDDEFLWSDPLTVTLTAAENFVATPNPPALITHTVTSHDHNYTDITEPVTVTITDDDKADVLIMPPTNPVIEGETITYTMRLNSQPTATVTLTPTFDTAQLAMIVPFTSLSFTEANWNITQTITLRAIDDVIRETDVQTTTATHMLSSDDPVYAALTVDPVEIAIADNNGPGVVIAPASVILSEGMSGTYPNSSMISVRLRTQPTSTVTVSLSPAGQFTADVTSLVFSPESYSVTQVITLTAVDELIDETDPHTATLALSTQSDDLNYSQLVASYDVAIEDDDTTYVSIGHAVPLNEGNGGLRRLHFPITLTLTAAVPVNVRYETFDFDAVGGADDPLVQGVDYQPILSGTLTFAPGETSKTISVIIRGDDDYELDEQFGVRLTAVGPVGALDSRSLEGVGIILNDDIAEDTG